MAHRDGIPPADVRLANCAARWHVTIETSCTTESALHAFGTRDSTSVVLKVARAPGAEWRAGELLAALDGHGVVPVFEHEAGAILMPRVEPAHQLTELSIDGR